MRALEVPEAELRAPSVPWLALGMLVVLGGLFAASGSLAGEDRHDPSVRAAGVVVGHGALLGVALAWAAPARRCRRGAVVVIGILAGAALTAGALEGGTVAFAAVPAALWWATRGRCAGALGLRLPVSLRAVALGAGLGTLLGGHVVMTATMTIGYPVRLRATRELLDWMLYDAGASVLAMECFFRGALFDCAQRRWSFTVAAAVSAAGNVARVLVDPLRPRTMEVTAGAIFYVALLSVTSCWLFHRTGSLVPGLASSLVFFLAYRLVMPGAP